MWKSLRTPNENTTDCKFFLLEVFNMKMTEFLTEEVLNILPLCGWKLLKFLFGFYLKQIVNWARFKIREFLNK